MRSSFLDPALATLVLLAGCGNPPIEPEPRLFLDGAFEFEVTRGIFFATGTVRSPSPGEKDLLLDVYFPTDERVPALRPGFVVVHESFDNGTRVSPTAVHLAEGYARRGYVTISMDYRQPQDDPPTEHLARDPNDPASVAAAAARVDASRAVEWLRANAATYGVDPGRIAVGGFSAGAITSLGLAYRDPGEDGAEAQAVVSMAGGLYGQESIIEAGDPPVILLHGTADPTVAFSQSEAIVARAVDVGLTYEFYPIEGGGHQVRPELGRIVDGMSLEDRIADFLYRHLDLSGAAGS